MQLWWFRWGHASMSMEILTGAEEEKRLAQLQWGHASMSMEIVLVSQPHPMETRFNGAMLQ